MFIKKAYLVTNQIITIEIISMVTISGIFCRRTQLLYKKLLFEDLHGFLIDLKKYFDRESPKTANQVLFSCQVSCFLKIKSLD